MNSTTKLLQPKHQKDLRKGRYSEVNQIYHITTTTKNRAPIFSDFSSARKLISTIRKSDDLNFTKTLAFVIMPDHMHWLIQLDNNATLQRIIRSMKSQSAKVIGMPIWQAGYYDHAIRKDEDIQNIARYIVANPIRAGLVTKVGDYPHWDAIWL
ncbi:transposase [Methylotenera sp.]|uniref:REP-associated tyrosine transposase n=1 Tax=Methylotenera sp. TaxID=2051956 RepID=UPI002723CF60|nr:transposase [Methylotenera sp.]MDO9205392.1 transposase [Methylotenera sp.]MDO9394361.1 transposase [Methylotenera sp.]MDP2070593.1 transposase [Methylotenera sp.]MDP3006193.1 transposase [Methylotenera sp.]MDP3307193.1 transposase [Methylotenera sp.]